MDTILEGEGKQTKIMNVFSVLRSYERLVRVLIALMMEATSTPETSVNLQQSAQRNNPEATS